MEPVGRPRSPPQSRSADHDPDDAEIGQGHLIEIDRVERNLHIDCSLGDGIVSYDEGGVLISWFASRYQHLVGKLMTGTAIRFVPEDSVSDRDGDIVSPLRRFDPGKNRRTFASVGLLYALSARIAGGLPALLAVSVLSSVAEHSK